MGLYRPDSHDDRVVREAMSRSRTAPGSIVAPVVATSDTFVGIRAEKLRALHPPSDTKFALERNAMLRSRVSWSAALATPPLLVIRRRTPPETITLDGVYPRFKPREPVFSVTVVTPSRALVIGAIRYRLAAAAEAVERRQWAYEYMLHRRSMRLARFVPPSIFASKIATEHTLEATPSTTHTLESTPATTHTAESTPSTVHTSDC